MSRSGRLDRAVVVLHPPSRHTTSRDGNIATYETLTLSYAPKPNRGAIFT